MTITDQINDRMVGDRNRGRMLFKDFLQCLCPFMDFDRSLVCFWSEGRRYLEHKFNYQH